jgi:hypothetical protein
MSGQKTLHYHPNRGAEKGKRPSRRGNAASRLWIWLFLVFLAALCGVFWHVSRTVNTDGGTAAGTEPAQPATEPASPAPPAESQEDAAKTPDVTPPDAGPKVELSVSGPKPATDGKTAMLAPQAAEAVATAEGSEMYVRTEPEPAVPAPSPLPEIEQPPSDRLSELANLLERSRGLAMDQTISIKLLVECLAERRPEYGITALQELLRRQAPTRQAPLRTTTELNALSNAADALLILDICRQQGPSGLFDQRETVEWLFADQERLAKVAATITPEDNWPEAVQIIETLFAHDPEGRDEYFDLILAMAVVWDQPRRLLHGQTGGNVPEYTPDIEKRYDYFKNLYATKKANIPYALLSVGALTFVVDTPVPISELEWARDNVRGSRTNWGNKYKEIKYDTERFEEGRLHWDYGAYTLQAIQERGGICVDQAYYGAMTARATGLPAIYFRGDGRRGGHAWFAYLRSETRWEMDIGRYTYDDYITGTSYDPQTNLPMTDHDVEFACDKVLKADAFAAADRLARLSRVMLQLDKTWPAEFFASRAIQLAPLHEVPWEVLEDALLRDNNLEGCVKLLDQKAERFRRYPDELLDIRRTQASLLKRLGRIDQAEQLLSETQRRLGREREDLAGDMAMRQLEQLIHDGENEAARESLEDLLMDQREGAMRILPLVEKYVTFTKETNQTKEAARFMSRLARRVHGTEEFETAFKELLAQSYENDGDLRRAERTRDRMSR